MNAFLQRVSVLGSDPEWEMECVLKFFFVVCGVVVLWGSVILIAMMFPKPSLKGSLDIENLDKIVLPNFFRPSLGIFNITSSIDKSTSY